jgi:hypothetical protein
MSEQPIWPTGQWRLELKKKDAEIERLKAVIESQNYSIDKHLGLITELCDALTESDPYTYHGSSDLIQRAREATITK